MPFLLKRITLVCSVVEWTVLPQQVTYAHHSLSLGKAVGSTLLVRAILYDF